MSQPTTTFRPRRRWFSFSLRSLFVLVTLAAIPVGWVAYERRQSQHEMQIAEELKGIGAGVVVDVGGLFDLPDPTNPMQPAKTSSWWREALSALCGPRIRTLDVSTYRLFSDLSPLAKLKCVRYLVLDDTQVSDLTPLAGLQDLEWLSLERTPVADLSPLARLTKLKCVHLDVVDADTSDPLNAKGSVVDISALASLKSLEDLSLDNNPVGDLSPLASLENLTILRGCQKTEFERRLTLA